MAYRVVFTQVTLDDVRAHAATMRLDEGIFVEDAFGAFGEEVPADADEAFARALSLDDDDDAPEEMDERWSHVCETLRYKQRLATPSYPYWSAIIDELTEEYPAARVIRPVGVRTLDCRVNVGAWDGRQEPSNSIGDDAAPDAVVARLREQIANTIGGEQFLAPDPEGRALAVLATTLTAILADPDASVREPRGTPLVRADVYEQAVASLGLDDLFQAVRRLLEADHEGYEPRLVSWPHPDSPKRPIGIIRSQGQQMVLVAPPLKYAP
jgi:hypothetical protein